MTPQDIDNLQNAINALQQSVNGLAGTTGVIGSSLNNFNGQVLNSAQTARVAGQSFQAAGQNIVSSSMSVAAAQQQAAQQMQQQSNAMAASANTLRQQIGQAASAVSNSTGNLSSLGGAVSAVGTGLGALAARLGITQGAAAALAATFSSVGNAFLGQTQNLLGARDALNKLGGVGQQTASSLYSYAHAAGLHSDTIGRMINPIASLGPALLGLGRGAGDAQKAFMELVQVGDQNRKQFANIGVFQEEMMRYQGNYIAAQDAAGVSLRMQNADMSKLRAASIEYIKNLYELSALTGEEVGSIEKRMKAAREDPLIQLKNLIEQQEIFAIRQQADQAEKEGDLSGAARLRDEANRREQEMLFRNSVVDQLSVLPASLQKGVKELITSGVLGKDNLQLFMSGAAPVIQELADQARNARDKETGALLAPEDQAKIFADLLEKEMYQPGGRLSQLATTLGPAALLPGNEQLRQQLFPQDTMAQMRRRPEDRAELRSEAAQQIASAMTSGADSASKIASSLQEAGITLGQVADRIAKQLNPFVQDFDINTQSPVATEEAKRQAQPTDELLRANSAINILDNISKSDQAAVNFLGSIADDVEKILGLFGVNVTDEANRFKELAQQSIGTGQQQSNPQQAKQASTPIAPVGSEMLRRGEGNITPPVTPAEAPVTPPATAPTEAPVTPPIATPAEAPVTPPIATPAEAPATAPTEAPVTPPIATPAEAPVTAPATAPTEAPVTAPATAPTEAPVTTPVKEPTQTPVKVPLAEPATVPSTITPPAATPPAATPPAATPPAATPNITAEQDRTTQTEINFQPITVKTNLGTTLELNASLVSKIAGLIRQSNDRVRSLRPRVMLALDSTGVKNVGKFDKKTIDEIIDKVANQARLPIPPGSTVGLAEPKAPVVEPPTEQQPQRPNIAELIDSGRLQADTPVAVASKIATPKLREGAVPTSLSKLIDTGIIDPKYLRGPQEIPTNIRTTAKGRKFADDADPKTRDTQGEGYGLDPKLLDSIVSLQRADFGDLTLQHITALNDYYHALNFKDTAHKEGRAVDFTLNKAPTVEQSAKIINILKGIGFSTIKDEYNNPTATTEGKHFHAEIPGQELPSLDMGGLVRGPKSGFPAMLHGNEMVIPLSPDSLLAELGKKTAEQYNSDTKNEKQQNENISTTSLKDDLLRANEVIAKVLTNKLDEVILKLDMGNQTSNKILRHSQV
jgi:hypothetical protein